MVINTGVSALARECGVCTKTIQWHLGKGRSQDQIRQYYAEKRAAGLSKQPHTKRVDGDAVEAKHGRNGGSRPAGYGAAPVSPRFASRFAGSSPAKGTRGGVKNPGRGNGQVLAEASFAGPGDRDEEQNGESIFSAQRRRAIALADAQEIANAVKRGELVEVERVRVWGEGVVRTTVDLLTRIPGQTQDRHAVETDPARCGEVTMEEIQRAVNEIRKMEELWRTKT